MTGGQTGPAIRIVVQVLVTAAVPAAPSHPNPPGPWHSELYALSMIRSPQRGVSDPVVVVKIV
jgi:hypothetical protein